MCSALVNSLKHLTRRSLFASSDVGQHGSTPKDGSFGCGWETEERLRWIILLHSLNDCWSVGTTEDLQLIITGEDEIINKIPCNKFFKWKRMFYLQYWPILGFKSMNKNKHAFLSNGWGKMYSIAFLSLLAKEDMRSVLQRGRQAQGLSARRINWPSLLCRWRFRP